MSKHEELVNQLSKMRDFLRKDNCVTTKFVFSRVTVEMQMVNCSCFLDTVVVSEPYRNQGFLTLFLDWLENAARQERVVSIHAPNILHEWLAVWLRDKRNYDVSRWNNLDWDASLYSNRLYPLQNLEGERA